MFKIDREDRGQPKTTFLATDLRPSLQQRREYRMTQRVENPLFYGGLVLFTGAVVGQVGLKVYEAVSASQARRAEEAAAEAAAEAEDADGDDDDDDSKEGAAARKAAGKKKRASARESGAGVFSGWFAKNFYHGGFEEKMTKREAALILGVREHATVDRIKDAHRKILILNHPDRGGSPLLSAKINEAKDLLMKGKDED
jgi:hypothetical protein